MSETREALNGQQIQALQKQMAEQFAGAIKDVELRKWSVDQACGLAGTAMENEAARPIDVVVLARCIHSFLTEKLAASPPNQV